MHPTLSLPKLTSFEMSGFVYLSDEVPTLSIEFEFTAGDLVMSSANINFMTPFYRTDSLKSDNYTKKFNIILGVRKDASASFH